MYTKIFCFYLSYLPHTTYDSENRSDLSRDRDEETRGAGTVPLHDTYVPVYTLTRVCTRGEQGL